MARHYIATAKFDPYSYQELAAPIARATAILSQQASSLNALEMQNASLAQYLDPEVDKEQYELYKYNEAKLRKASNDLMQHGLTSNTYRLMRDASMMYSRDIKPMQSAIDIRSKWKAGVVDFLMKNPDVELKGSLNKPLSEFYNGMPQASFVSGNAIKKDVSELATLYANAKDPTMTKERWSDYQDKIYTQYGYTLPELERARQPGSFEYDMMMQVLAKHGVIDYNSGQNLMNDQQAYDKMLRYAQEGLTSLLGKKTVDLKNNDLDKRQDWIYKQQHLATQRQSARSSSEKEDKDVTPFVDIRNVAYSKNVDGTANEMREWILKLPAKNQKLYNNALVNVMTAYKPDLKGDFINELRDAHGTVISIDSERNRSNTNRANNLMFKVEYIPKDGTQKKSVNIPPEAFGFTADYWDNLQSLDEVNKFKFTPWDMSVEENIQLGNIFQLIYDGVNDLLQEEVNG